MRIKYVKGTHDSLPGDIKDVPEVYADVLISVGVAVEFIEEPKTEVKKRVKKTK